MIHQSLSEGGHKWEKQNLVTISGRKGNYDIYKCSQCGIEGRSYHLGTIDIPEKFAHKANSCPKLLKKGKIRVIRCTAVGAQFKNLTPNSIHNVIDVPAGKSSTRGVWVMGVDEPVMLLYGEFNFIDE